MPREPEREMSARSFVGAFGMVRGAGQAFEAIADEVSASSISVEEFAIAYRVLLQGDEMIQPDTPLSWEAIAEILGMSPKSLNDLLPYSDEFTFNDFDEIIQDIPEGWTIAADALGVRLSALTTAFTGGYAPIRALLMKMPLRLCTERRAIFFQRLEKYLRSRQNLLCRKCSYYDHNRFLRCGVKPDVAALGTGCENFEEM